MVPLPLGTGEKLSLVPMPVGVLLSQCYLWTPAGIPCCLQNQRASFVVSRRQRASFVLLGCKQASAFRVASGHTLLLPLTGCCRQGGSSCPLLIYACYIADSVVPTGLWNPPNISPKFRTLNDIIIYLSSTLDLVITNTIVSYNFHTITINNNFRIHKWISTINPCNR